MRKKGGVFTATFNNITVISWQSVLLVDAGADPGFQVRGGALKKIAPSGGRRENVWGISCDETGVPSEYHRPAASH